MKVAAINLLRSAREVVQVAQACEEAGFWGLGLGDTAPRLYQDAYATAGACLAATTSLHIGPTVTNTVSRSWGVAAASARTFDELAPGRFFTGVGTGDGAVHSIGMKPATWSRLERDVVALREFAPPDHQVHIAASGPVGAQVAGRAATDLMLGTGMEPEALQSLAGRASAARTAAGIDGALRTWVVADTFITADRDAAARARHDMRARANGFARFAFATTFDGKAVPERWQPVLRERLVHYDFGSHAMTGDTPNARLFEDHPELQSYLVDRFLLVGTAEQVREKVAHLASSTDLAGVWLAVGPSTVIERPAEMIKLIGQALGDLIS